jgi:hypothetical protein
MSKVRNRRGKTGAGAGLPRAVLISVQPIGILIPLASSSSSGVYSGLVVYTQSRRHG